MDGDPRPDWQPNSDKLHRELDTSMPAAGRDFRLII